MNFFFEFWILKNLNYGMNNSSTIIDATCSLRVNNLEGYVCILLISMDSCRGTTVSSLNTGLNSLFGWTYDVGLMYRQLSLGSLKWSLEFPALSECTQLVLRCYVFVICHVDVSVVYSINCLYAWVLLSDRFSSVMDVFTINFWNSLMFNIKFSYGISAKVQMYA